jgi:hypothetical protein
MRTKLLTPCLVVLALGNLCLGTETQKDLEKQLRSKIKGQIFWLLKPYLADTLEFDGGGRLSGNGETGSPAMNGLLQITSLSVNKDALRIVGWRVIAVLTSGQNENFSMVVTDLPIHITIHLAQPLSDESDAQVAWAKVFSISDKNKNLAGFWKPFSEGKGDGKTSPHEDADGVAGFLDNRPVYNRGARSVVPPKVRKSDRAEHHPSAPLIGGHTSIRMIIDEHGRPALLMADEPSNPLQSDAIATAARLSFTPATKDGSPISVLMSFETEHHIQ